MPFVKWILQRYLQQAMRDKLAETVAEHTRQGADGSDGGQPVGPCEVGVVCGLAVEGSGLAARLEDSVALRGEGFTAQVGHHGDRRIAVVHSGGGSEATSRATAALIEGHRPQWIIAAGLASATSDELRQGEFLMPNRILAEGRQPLSVDVRLSSSASAEGPRVHVGPLYSAEEAITAAQARRELHQEHGAICVDRDTFAVARVCQAAKTRFMAVRIVCNAVDQPPPPDLLRQLRGKSLAERAGAATRVILDKPDGAKKLWQDKSLITRLADQLGMFLIGTIEQLPLDDQSESAASRDD